MGRRPGLWGLTLAAALAAGGAKAGPVGLTVGPHATAVLQEKPVRAIGINYFDCFLRTLKDGGDTSYEAGFGVLEKKGIPFVRFCATGFWPRDMELYQKDREEYFRRLDAVVAAAGRRHVGLIPSLFWSFACVPDLVGEPMDQWGNPQSKTLEWMRGYVREVVGRYRENQSVWAWEVGNEFSLQASLPNAKEHRAAVHPGLGTAASRSARDDLTFAMVRVTFAEFAKTVREQDPHRLILTGDSFPRLSAWHQEHEGAWTHDTKAQFQEALTLANPDPVSGISVHAYEDDDQRFPWAIETARKLNKPLFIGEFGAQGTSAEQAAKFRRLLKAIVAAEIPLAAVWVFDFRSQPDFNITPEPGDARAWQLDEIATANRQLQAAAKGAAPKQ